MDEMPGADVAQRLARLERGIRRWRALGAVAWLLLAGGLALNTALLLKAMAPADAETEAPDDGDGEPRVTHLDDVHARSFVLVDSDGHPRAALALRPDGSPALAFTDADGRVIWVAPPGERAPR